MIFVHGLPCVCSLFHDDDPRRFLHNLTTSLAVFVRDLSSLAWSFSEIFRILVELSGSFGLRAFLLRLRAQYSDLIKFLQIEVLSVLNAGRIYLSCSSLMTSKSFLTIPWIIEKWMKARMFCDAFSMMVWYI